MQIVVVSGLSGSGKSIALNALEDAGYYCVDNLPSSLLRDVVLHLVKSGQRRIAVSIDIRGRDALAELPEQSERLKGDGYDLRVLFLDASTETLVKRFSESRRPHPLASGELTLTECIALERELLSHIPDLGHRVDTSELRPNTLRAWVQELVQLDRSGITLLFESFGFKNGIPLDADFVFDVRCLPNPHYEPELRALTGRDQAVIDYLDAQEGVQIMLDDIRRFVEKWLPCFIGDNRAYLTVAIGCTGGQHRSVCLVEKLAAYFREKTQVLVRHRELV